MCHIKWNDFCLNKKSQSVASFQEPHIGMNITLNKNTDQFFQSDIWIISKGIYSNTNLNRICDGARAKTTVEYRVSDLARYLLNPNPVQVNKKLIGCEIHFHSSYSKFKEKIIKILPKILSGRFKNKPIASEVLILDPQTNQTPMKDENLESHVNMIDDFLRFYDPVFKKLSSLESKNLSDVIGICEEIDGSRSWLNLQGGIHEKIDYLIKFLSQEVTVILDKAYNLDGLFELKGFDFTLYDSSRSHRLIKFTQDGKTRCCVLNSYGHVAYWIEDINLVRYLHLLEQSIQTNPRLKDAFNQCIQGNAKALKLFFNKQPGIDYSQIHLPEIYRKVFERYNIHLNKKDIVTRLLNNSQIGILFSYVPRTGAGEEKLFTNFSVMHNFRALEPIKNDLPQVYSEINKRAPVTEAGKFYLLDSFRETKQ